MIRRSFMAFLGLAPVAAVTPVVQEVVYNPVVSGTNKIMTQNSLYVEDYNPIKHAREKLAALKKAKENDLLTNFHETFYEQLSTDVRTFRSWSEAHKCRKITEKIAVARTEYEIRRAEYELEREMKKSLLPEWMRRFI